jgi:hypothetical protein
MHFVQKSDFNVTGRVQNFICFIKMFFTIEAHNLLGCTAVLWIQFRTRQYIPEDSDLHTRLRENLKSHFFTIICSYT